MKKQTVKHGGSIVKIRNRAELEDLLNILSSAIGSLTNPTKLSATFKSVKQKTISKVTITRYIEYLCDAFLIDSAVRYDIKGKKYIGTPVKYYFTDIGLRNARLNFRQLEETHTMENIIFNELKIRGFNVDIRVVVVNGSGKDGSRVRKQYEIDFVCNKGSKRYYTVGLCDPGSGENGTGAAFLDADRRCFQENHDYQRRTGTVL